VNEALLTLHLSGMIGVSLYRRLITFFERPESALRAKISDLQRVPGIGPRTAQAIREAAERDAGAREIERAGRAGIHLLSFEEEDYPAPLKTLYDPPLAISRQGEYRDPIALAMVGSRQCTDYGRRQSARFAAEFAGLGITVVSGLARGIDTAAHRGALRQGRTIAVLGSGLQRIYPSENRALAAEISERGCLFSEFGLTVPPEPVNFPRRNRIISGLALGVLVVEAGEKSGALITADWALDQAREVFCLPGSVENPMSRGSHRLIKQGAKLVETPADVLEEIPAFSSFLQPSMEFSPIERAVAGRLTEQAASLESLTENLRIPAETIVSVLDRLVKKGAVESRAEGFVRVRGVAIR